MREPRLGRPWISDENVRWSFFVQSLTRTHNKFSVIIRLGLCVFTRWDSGSQKARSGGKYRRRRCWESQRCGLCASAGWDKGSAGKSFAPTSYDAVWADPCLWHHTGQAWRKINRNGRFFFFFFPLRSGWLVPVLFSSKKGQLNKWKRISGSGTNCLPISVMGCALSSAPWIKPLGSGFCSGRVGRVVQFLRFRRKKEDEELRRKRERRQEEKKKPFRGRSFWSQALLPQPRRGAGRIFAWWCRFAGSGREVLLQEVGEVIPTDEFWTRNPIQSALAWTWGTDKGGILPFFNERDIV